MQRNFAYIHQLCGKPAFFMEENPDHEPRSYQVELPDGTKPVPGSYMVCGSCGEKLGRITRVNVKPWTQ